MDAGTRLTARRPYAKAPVEENCPVANSTLMPIGTGTRFASSANYVSGCEHAKDYVNKYGLPAHLTETVVETITNAAVTVNIQGVLSVAKGEKPCGLPIRRRETQCSCAKHVKTRRKNQDVGHFTNASARFSGQSILCSHECGIRRALLHFVKQQILQVHFVFARVWIGSGFVVETHYRATSH